jgi:hypothetical protein
MPSRHEMRRLREIEVKSKEVKPTKKRGRPKKNAKK